MQLETASRHITLTRGLTALVDQDDFDRVSQFSWQAVKGHNGVFYARTHSTLYMHRFIYAIHYGSIPSWCQIDHANRDGLDNRKLNIRLSDSSQQQHNSSKRLNHSSRFKGVHKTEDGWRAMLYKNGICYSLGVFDSEEEAAQAYNCKALELCGDYARLNLV